MSMQLLITLLLIIIWCLVIFTFSNMPGKESQGKSRELTEKLVKTILKIINKKVKEENSRHFKWDIKKVYACK